VSQGLIDIMLMSNSISEQLTLRERIFDDTAITPAVRANDTTDVHVVRGGVYPRVASRPFRSATLDQIQCAKARCEDSERALGPDLGLYSITFNNDRDLDLESIKAYKDFRIEAETVGFRHFLEVFDPNIPNAVEKENLGHFINDSIIRTLAAAPTSSRPVFIKTVYHGPRFMEELVHYDSHLIVGVMGGAAGTTFDAFNLLYQAKKYGARAALFGRKINQAEHQPAFVKFLRLLADGEIEPGEAVRAYHDVLQKLEIRPLRKLEEDLLPEVDLFEGDELSSASVIVPEFDDSRDFSSSDGNSVEPPISESEIASQPNTLSPNDPQIEPDFDTMTTEQKLEYNQRRRDQIFG